MRLVSRVGITLGLAAAALAAGAALAQGQGIRRTLLQRVDVAGAEPRECVLGSAELPPGASAGKHYHHGFEVGVVVEGEGDLAVDGEASRRLKAGDSYRIDAGKPHDVKNTGAAAFKVVATWVVEKGKPLSEPAR